MLNNRNCAIGVFDSGLGGLTVVKELMRLLPFEDIVYYGDTARVPYGTKSKESIVRFSLENAHVLLKYKVKMIVVACNSSSSYALGALRKTFKLPVVGVIAPGVRKALELTTSNRVGVIATSATINSQKYARTAKKIKKAVRVTAIACPLFVPLVEEGWLSKSVTLDIAGEYLKKLKQAKVDTLILGCTHYPLLKSSISKVMGPNVVLVDSAQAVAAEVKSILKRRGMDRQAKRKARYRFFVSDKPQEFRKIARSFLGKKIRAVKI